MPGYLLFTEVHGVQFLLPDIEPPIARAGRLFCLLSSFLFGFSWVDAQLSSGCGCQHVRFNESFELPTSVGVLTPTTVMQRETEVKLSCPVQI